MAKNPFQNDFGSWVAEHDGTIGFFDTEEEALYWLKKQDDEVWEQEGLE